jgi:hypothetical protein
MSATSVTGVGLGSADKRQKGSEHLRVGAEKIIGPRCVYAKQHTLDGSGDLTIKLPAFTGVTGDYIVLATDTNATAAAVSASLTISGSAATIVLDGTAAHVINVAVFKTGLAI